MNPDSPGSLTRFIKITCESRISSIINSNHLSPTIIKSKMINSVAQGLGLLLATSVSLIGLRAILQASMPETQPTCRCTSLQVCSIATRKLRVCCVSSIATRKLRVCCVSSIATRKLRVCCVSGIATHKPQVSCVSGIRARKLRVGCISGIGTRKLRVGCVSGTEARVGCASGTEARKLRIGCVSSTEAHRLARKPMRETLVASS